jgi:predicted permease
LHAQVREELEFHVETYAADLMHNGVPRDEAMRRARVELGSIPAGSEQCRAAWGTQFVDHLRADLRFAGRMLAKSPAFTLIAAGSLALAVGANATIFAVGHQILYGRLSMPHPEELRTLQTLCDEKCAGMSGWGEWLAAPNHGSIGLQFPYPMYQQLRSSNHELGDLVAFKDDSMNATVHGDAQRAEVDMVSGNFYEQMQVPVQIGRPLQPSDDAQPGAGTVAVISDGLWQREYGRSPAVIGQIVRVNQQPMTIVGVNPRGFTGPKGAMNSPDIVVPITMQPVIDPKGKESLLDAADMWWVNIAARVKPGLNDETAQAALAARFTALARGVLKPAADQTLPKLQVVDGSRGLHVMEGSFAKPIYVLFAFTVLLLLLACVNVANLLLARGSQRQREINVRMAMGAARRRIMRQLFTESLLLASLGGTGGLMLSFAGRNLFPRLMDNPWEHNEITIPFDWRVFSFALLVTFNTAVIFGLLPAWLESRGDVSSHLKESTHQATRRQRAWSGKGIVVLQIALSTMLVIGAGIFLRTVLRLNSVDLGFQPDPVLLFDIHPPAKRYANGKDVELHMQLEEKIAALPGVESVAPAWMPLASGAMANSDFVTEDKFGDGKNNPPEDENVVGNTYFRTMQIPMIAGRAFDASDTASSVKVAVINQGLARARFPNVNPIGRRFRVDDDKVHTWIQVVGICANTRYADIKNEPPPVFYLPYVQQKEVGGMTYQIRTHSSEATLVPALRRIVQQADPDLPLIDIRTEREQIDATMQTERTLATLTAAFGMMALLLASVGIYGMMAFSVARRTNEIGIRMALGARSAQVMRMVLSEAGWMTTIGIVAGLGGALALGRVVTSLLYGLKPWDPATLGSAAVVLALVALAASWIPARRAARIDPMQALRHE